MNVKKTFAEILKTDSKVRLLLGGMVVDGALLIALVVLVGLVIGL